MREQVVSAIFNKSVILVQQGKARAGIEAYDMAINRFGNDTAPGVREWVAKALVNKGTTLGQLGDAGGRIAAYEEAVQRFGNDTTPGIRDLVAKLRAVLQQLRAN